MLICEILLRQLCLLVSHVYAPRKLFYRFPCDTCALSRNSFVTLYKRNLLSREKLFRNDFSAVLILLFFQLFRWKNIYNFQTGTLSIFMASPLVIVSRLSVVSGTNTQESDRAVESAQNGWNTFLSPARYIVPQKNKKEIKNSYTDSPTVDKRFQMQIKFLSVSDVPIIHGPLHSSDSHTRRSGSLVTSNRKEEEKESGKKERAGQNCL